MTLLAYTLIKCGSSAVPTTRSQLNGSDQGYPGKRIGPLADRMGVRDTVGDPKAEAASGQPVLKMA
jgi:hypothetical protein